MREELTQLMQNPILLDFPEQFYTSHLLIRTPLPGDGEPMNEAIRESLPSLRPWMPWAREIPTIAESEQNVRWARVRFLTREDLRMHLFHRESGRFLGASGLHRMNWVAGRFEIGYWLRDGETGNGYATEAVNGIVNFAIHHLHAQRIEIRCDSQNRRSQRVAERCGFSLEAILARDSVNEGGHLRDTLVFVRFAPSNSQVPVEIQ